MQRSVVVSMHVLSLVGLAFGCTDPSRPAGVTTPAAAVAMSSATCPTPVVRGRSADAPGVYAPLELVVAIGDTVRLARLWASNPAAPSTASTRWRVVDSALALVEKDLVIPLHPGRTQVTGTYAGQTLCIALVTLMSGVQPTQLTAFVANEPLALTDTVRLGATVRYSSGLNLPLRDAVAWRSLDPSVATVGSDGWTTPRAEGSARIVATAGPLVDTVLVHVANAGFESLVPRPAEEFVSSIGLNIHLSYFDRVYGSGYRTIILPRLQELGVRHLRDGGTWLPNQDWMREVYDRWQEVARSTGAQFTVIVSPRRTATGPGTDYGDMSHLRELRDRIGADHIAAWEGLNEHDRSGRADFPREIRTAQRALYELVKGDPQMMAARHRVLGPSVAVPAAASRVGDLSTYMDEGVIHPYPGGNVPGSNLAEHTAAVRAISGTRPLEATETGYHTTPVTANPWHWSVSEGAQARYLLREFLQLYSAGIVRTFSYELIDEGTNSADMEDHFGLLRNDGSRKPAFDALRNLIAMLGDRDAPSGAPHPLRVRFTGDTAGMQRLLLQKADGRRYLVLWQNARSFDEISRRDIVAPDKSIDVIFPSAQTRLNVFFPLHGAGISATYRAVRTLRLAISDHPVVLEVVN